MFIQSHTPFAAMDQYKHNKTVLVVGGEGDNCRKIAEAYGFRRVVTPLDILVAYPEVWYEVTAHVLPWIPGTTFNTLLTSIGYVRSSNVDFLSVRPYRSNLLTCGLMT